MKITWVDEGLLLDTLPVDGSGCIDSPLNLPHKEGGLFILEAESDNGLTSAAIYQMFDPVEGVIFADGFESTP